MSAPHTNEPTKLTSRAGSDPNASEHGTSEATQAQTSKTARDAERVIEKTAEASGDAARANGEFLRRNAETAQHAVRSGFAAGAQSLHSLAETMSRSFGMTNSNPELAAQSAQNIRAVSEASTALARGTQEASRVWLDLIKSGVRANVEAFGELANCRSVHEITALQCKLSREYLQRAIESGEQITQASGRAISEASRAISSSRA